MGWVEGDVMQQNIKVATPSFIIWKFMSVTVIGNPIYVRYILAS